MQNDTFALNEKTSLQLEEQIRELENELSQTKVESMKLISSEKKNANNDLKKVEVDLKSRIQYLELSLKQCKDDHAELLVNHSDLKKIVKAENAKSDDPNKHIMDEMHTLIINEKFLERCEKHFSNSINSFKTSVDEVVDQLKPDEAKKLLEHMLVIEYKTVEKNEALLANENKLNDESDRQIKPPSLEKNLKDHIESNQKQIKDLNSKKV
jgi:phage-related minor tail protein